MAKYSKKRAALCTIAAVCLATIAIKRRNRKRRHCWIRKWIGRRDVLGLSSTLVQELESEDVSEYRSMFRMDQDSFMYLLNLVRGLIEKQHTVLRDTISAEDAFTALKCRQSAELPIFRMKTFTYQSFFSSRQQLAT